MGAEKVTARGRPAQKGSPYFLKIGQNWVTEEAAEIEGELENRVLRGHRGKG